MKFDAEYASHGDTAVQRGHVSLYRSHGDGTVSELVVSRAAMHLHTFGVLTSIESGTPGFVSDSYLNSIRTETSIAALELTLVGLWERAAHGYRVSDRDTMDVDKQLHRTQPAQSAGRSSSRSPAPFSLPCRRSRS